MANENLKNALKDAGLTAEEFAEIIRVDPKSVGRWLNGNTVPYPRHRAKIARALDLTERELWPKHTPTPAAADADHDKRDLPGLGAETELTGTWAYTTDEGAPDPAVIIHQATGPIDLLDSGRWINLTEPLTTALLAQADAGRRIRLLTSLPKPKQVAPLLGHSQIEVRATDGSWGYSLIRVGDTILFTINVPIEAERPLPLLKLIRATDDGLFDRLAENLEALWEDAYETITTLDQLDAYLTNTDEDDEDEEFDEDQDWKWTENPEPDTPQPADTAQPATASTPGEPEPTPRRWPRQPD